MSGGHRNLMVVDKVYMESHQTSWNTMFLVNPSGLFKHTARADGSVTLLKATYSWTAIVSTVIASTAITSTVITSTAIVSTVIVSTAIASTVVVDWPPLRMNSDCLNSSCQSTPPGWKAITSTAIASTAIISTAIVSTAIVDRPPHQISTFESLIYWWWCHNLQ